MKESEAIKELHEIVDLLKSERSSNGEINKYRFKWRNMDN